MALWGHTDTDEAKPKWFTTEQKEDIIATQHGWVAKPGSKFAGNSRSGADPEILCFIKGLSGKLGTGDIAGIDWITTAFDKSEGGTLSCRVHFNEAVTVTGNPKVVVSGTGGRNHNLPYVSGSGTSSLVFTSASINGGDSATNANDVLSFGADCMAQVGGSTIVDTRGDSLGTQTVTSSVDVGSTTFPTATLDNSNIDFGTTAALGAVTAKVVSATVVAGGSGYAVNEVVTIDDDFGTGTNATYKVTAICGGGGTGPATAVEIVNAGAYTALGGGVAAIPQESSSASGSNVTVNVTLGVSQVAISTAGTEYAAAPKITFAGTGLEQDDHTCTLTGRAAAITSSAGIGTAAGTITVSA